MAQFDVYENANPRTKKWTPFLVDIQSDLLEQLATRVVVPLRKYTDQQERIVTKLHPVVDIGDTKYAAIVSELAAIPASGLDAPIFSIQHARQEIIEAIDLIFTGF